VLIGAGVVILPGTRIERGAVIGAGSVVSGSVPEYAIVAGAPARVIGHRE
jgi:acetyltransferase-like isoleucine patch superfamily enzyme